MRARRRTRCVRASSAAATRRTSPRATSAGAHAVSRAGRHVSRPPRRRGRPRCGSRAEAQRRDVRHDPLMASSRLAAPPGRVLINEDELRDARRRARRGARARLRDGQPRARRRAQGRARVHGRPRPRHADRAHDRLHRALELRGRHPVVGRGEAGRRPLDADRGPARGHRRGHHRHGAHGVLPQAQPRDASSRARCGSARSSTRSSGATSTSTSTISASRSRTSSWSGTGWITLGCYRNLPYIAALDVLAGADATARRGASFAC